MQKQLTSRKLSEVVVYELLVVTVEQLCSMKSDENCSDNVCYVNFYELIELHFMVDANLMQNQVQ